MTAAPAPSAVNALAQIHKARLAGCRNGTWPQHSIEEWRRIARGAGERPDGVTPSPVEQRALEVVAAAGGSRR